MKRMILAGLLAFSTTLTACCCTLPINKKEEAPQPTESHSHLETMEPETTTEATTEATTTTSATSARPVTDYKTVNYTLPVANPDKKVYDAPDGNLVGTFDTIGYFTIVEQATDADGYTWGRMENSTNWTLVYYEILPELTMHFSSGVGGWGTSLTLAGKGTFTGSFEDSDMGDSGSDYPNGTRYVCDFNGTFRVTAIDGNSVTLEMTSLKTKKAEGATWIEDGTRYVASDAYGLEGGTEFILYYPTTPVSQIPSAVRYWNEDLPTYGALGCYALYCPAIDTAFFG